MSNKDRVLLVALIGAFVLTGIIINHAFTLLTPLPDGPEMARAKAEALLMEAEANIQAQYLFRTFLVGLLLIISGIVVCFGSFWIALRILTAPLRLHQRPMNLHALTEVRHDEID